MLQSFKIFSTRVVLEVEHEIPIFARHEASETHKFTSNVSIVSSMSLQ